MASKTENGKIMIPIKEAFPPHKEDDEYHYHPWYESYEPNDKGEWVHEGPSYPNIVKSMGVEIITDEKEDDYQGDWFFVVKRAQAPQYGWLVCGFGSCSGCDALEGSDTYEDLESLRSSLYTDIRWFDTQGELVKFLQQNLDIIPGDPDDAYALMVQTDPPTDYYWYGHTEEIRTIVERLVPEV